MRDVLAQAAGGGVPVSRPRRDAGKAESRRIGLYWTLAGLGWLALWLWARSPYASYLGHSGGGAPGARSLVTLGLFCVGWVVMIAAMMLPTATGLMAAFGSMVSRRRHRGLLEGAVVAGFVGVWLVVGLAFRIGDIGVHLVVDAIAWLAARPQLIGAAVLVGAGLFQFSPLKYRCVTACRSPKSFVYAHWGRGRPVVDALRIGVGYGRSCIGCCWALMLLLFALGVSSLEWMIGLTVLVALEKHRVVGRRIVVAAGAALLVLGVCVLLGIGPGRRLFSPSGSASVEVITPRGSGTP